MKWNDLTENQRHQIVKDYPEWVAYHRPEWMAAHYPWMVEHHPEPDNPELPKDIAESLKLESEE